MEEDITAAEVEQVVELLNLPLIKLSEQHLFQSVQADITAVGIAEEEIMEVKLILETYMHLAEAQVVVTVTAEEEAILMEA